MNWRQAIPTALTLAAMLSGFLSILLTVEGMRMAEPGGYYSKSALLIMLAMILDGLDGNVARWLNGSSEFGAELDTYVDLTAFGIAPAILVFAVTLQGNPVWRVVLPSAVALSGMVRLARFKVKDPLRGQAGYAGLPITANAAWVALFVFITLTPPRDQFSLNSGRVAVLFLVGILVFISLQVTNLRYPKPTKKSFLFFPCVVLVVLLWILQHRIAARVAVVMILLGTGYVVFGPLFVRGYEAHRARRDARLNGSNAT
jgi:CDP-diacylglycerol--serine O-phosphatidyltransferase